MYVRSLSFVIFPGVTYMFYYNRNIICFEPGLHVFNVSMWIPFRCFAPLPQSRDMRVRLIGFVSLCVNSVMNWQPVQVVPHHSANVSWD